MNNLLTNITVLLFVLTLYGIIYRSISGVFKAVQQYRDAKQQKREEARRLEALKNSLLNLSKKEMAILKFVLLQDLHSAWLPDNYKPVMILIEKGYLVQIGLDGKSISNLQYMFDYSIAHLFTVPDNIQQLIAHMPPEFSKKWRKIKPDWKLKDCQ